MKWFQCLAVTLSPDIKMRVSKGCLVQNSDKELAIAPRLCGRVKGVSS